ncbi:Serine carboxypeptidase-like 49 [Abeliophyllum distichum]|uniref:Serine carboxypeptidase-like 49 n=1 Tax=Abeliophyllum distichum TaxID=126358 RepID=A0ABD1TEP5_9LAMI
MTPPLSHCSLFLLFLSSFVPSYSVAATCDVNHLLHSTFEFPKTQAGKIIRELNLFLELDDDAVTAPKLVEKRIQFPNLRDDGDTVRNLGHRAGYHRLPHSKAARFNGFQLFSDNMILKPKNIFHSFHADRDTSNNGYFNREQSAGLAIGNGLTNPEIQYKAYTDYALAMKLINQSDYNRISRTILSARTE